jgi:hypothetical protein
MVLLKKLYEKQYPYALAVLDTVATKTFGSHRSQSRSLWLWNAGWQHQAKCSSAPWLVPENRRYLFRPKAGACDFGSGKRKSVAEKFDLALTFDSPGQSKFGTMPESSSESRIF